VAPEGLEDGYGRKIYGRRAWRRLGEVLMGGPAFSTVGRTEASSGVVTVTVGPGGKERGEMSFFPLSLANTATHTIFSFEFIGINLQLFLKEELNFSKTLH
jgi:hypothetical protein